MSQKKVPYLWRITACVCLAAIVGLAGVATYRYLADLHLKPSQQTVVLVPGLLDLPFMMDGIAKVFREAGYPVYKWKYPDSVTTVEDQADSLDTYVKSLEPNRRIHFVGYSQGGILIRYMSTHYRIPHKGRIVMIGPPNHGSELAEHYHRYAWFKMVYGKTSVKDLFPSRKKFFEECGIPPMEFGIIAGGKGDGKGYSDILPGDDDGMVSVESAHLEKAKGFILLHNNHLTLVRSEETARQTLHFIQTGNFTTPKQ